MNRNHQPGVLANARVGKPLHPQASAMAGGMTYKPPAGHGEPESHTLPAEGSTPSPASDDDTVELRRICPVPTKDGGECRSYPGPDGLCTGHRNARRAAEAKE